MFHIQLQKEPTHASIRLSSSMHDVDRPNWLTLLRYLLYGTELSLLESLAKTEKKRRR